MTSVLKPIFSFSSVLITLLLLQSQVVAQERSAALNFEMKDIAGKKVSLSKYAGKVVVFVNVASKCGMTPQYKQLQKLHDDYASKGVAIIGVPCNQFGGQEPETEKEILEFCKENYGVKFDMMSKVDVNGKDQHPLYKHLNGLDLKPKGSGDVKWNFEKFVIGKDGTPIARFGSRTKPDSKEFVAAIDSALGVGAGAAGYSHESKKSGKTYYLFKKEVPLKNSDKVQTIYFFAKDPNNPKGTPLSEVPDGKVVSETKTGMLVLKNKK